MIMSASRVPQYWTSNHRDRYCIAITSARKPLIVDLLFVRLPARDVRNALVGARRRASAMSSGVVSIRALEGIMIVLLCGNYQKGEGETGGKWCENEK